MAETLPSPDPDAFPDLTEAHLREVPAGTAFGRIFFASGSYGTSWSTFRSWGPTTSRFDHHDLAPPQDHPDRGIMYVAPAIPGPTGEVYPALKLCLAECFRDTGVVNLERHQPYFAVFETTRMLHLLDLADTDWVLEAGANGAISSGPRDRAREWAQAIYEAYSDIDGLIYPSSNVPQARSVALWERGADALPARPTLHMPLDDVGLRAAIETYAGQMRMPVVGA